MSSDTHSTIAKVNQIRRRKQDAFEAKHPGKASRSMDAIPVNDVAWDKFKALARLRGKTVAELMGELIEKEAREWAP